MVPAIEDDDIRTVNNLVSAKRTGCNGDSSTKNTFERSNQRTRAGIARIRQRPETQYRAFGLIDPADLCLGCLK